MTAIPFFDLAEIGWPPETLWLIAAVFLFAGLVKGTLGLGLPVIVIALLAQAIGLSQAIGLMLVPAVVMNSWQGMVGGGFVELLKRLWPLFATAIVGIWFGVQILARSDAGLLLTVLAIVLIIYAGLALTRPQIRPPGRLEPVLTPIVGFVSGLMFGMVGNIMVPGVIYLQALGLSRDRLVQALGMTFITISVTLLISMTRFSLIDHKTLLVSVGAMVPAVIGMAIGQRLRRHLDEAQFRFLFFVGLLVVGVHMPVRAQWG